MNIYPRQPRLPGHLEIKAHNFQIRSGPINRLIVPKAGWNNNYPTTTVFFDRTNPLPQQRIWELPEWQTREDISYYPRMSGSYSRNNYTDDIYSQMQIAKGIRQYQHQKNIF